MSSSSLSRSLPGRNGVTTQKTRIFSHAALETSNLVLRFLARRTARYVGHPSRRSLILHSTESTCICYLLAAHHRFQILFHGMWPQNNTMNTYISLNSVSTTLDVGVSKLSRNIVYTSIHGFICQYWNAYQNPFESFKRRISK